MQEAKWKYNLFIKGGSAFGIKECGKTQMNVIAFK